MNKENYDVCVIGGTGHVGLPLGIMLADSGLRTLLLDINQESIDLVNSGKMPFIEHGASNLLKKANSNKKLFASSDKTLIKKSNIIIVAIGTPVDEYLNPKIKIFLNFFKDIYNYLNLRQTLIIRSSVYPKTCDLVFKILKKKKINLSYCPERIVQGYAIKELKSLPQIISGYNKKAKIDSEKIFKKITNKIVYASVYEAELAKLFSNAMRYIKFSTSNQFFMMCEKLDVNFYNVKKIMSEGYNRSNDIPKAGFVSGPCLLKDTMQLSAFFGGNFLLGNAAMNINEGLPYFVVQKIKEKFKLKNNRVGILGMSFKAEVDDIRDSLSYKLGKILMFDGYDVMFSDEYVKDETFVKKDYLIKKSDLIIIAAPHKKYKKLKFPKSKLVINIWEKSILDE
tara:strand:- start:6948 stop:8135 length:1188 start_codon:yes stop_codon:yes gene_type:complete